MGVLPRTRLLLGTSSGRAGLAGLVVLVFFAIFGHAIWGDAATTIDTAAMLEGPSREHLAGTDALGRDVLARVFVATRPSLWYARAGHGGGVDAGHHPRPAAVGARPPGRRGAHRC